MFVFYILLSFFILTVKTECLNGSIPTFTNSNLCYFLQPSQTYYLEAERECQNLGGHLTSVHDMLDNMFLAQEALLAFTDSANSDFWFGINDLAETGNRTWLDNSTIDFTDWDKGQPQNVSGSGCGAVIMDEKPFVCLLKGTIPTTTTTVAPKICPESWTYFNQTGFCYTVLKNETWLNSGERCKQENAELASLHLLTEANFVANLSFNQNDGTHDVWIGLFTVDDNAHWSWTDGTPFDLPNWDVNQPDGHGIENCGTIRKSGKFNNWQCPEYSKFVCKKLPE